MRSPRPRHVLRLVSQPPRRHAVHRSRVPFEAPEVVVPTSGSTNVPPPPPLPKVLSEVRENIRRFSHCLVLTRVGSFYEAYFEQAHTLAQLCHLKLASRRLKASQTVAMAGFPLAHLDRHLATLVQENRIMVALCEEIRRPGQLKEFDRRVVRVVSRGTLIDEDFVDGWGNNYLLAVGRAERAERAERGEQAAQSKETVPAASPQDRLGADGSSAADTPAAALSLAYLDLSTGDFYTETCTTTTLPDALSRIRPAEIILKQGDPLVLPRDTLVSYDDGMAEGLGLDAPEPGADPASASARALLLSYLRRTLLSTPTLYPVEREPHMRLDAVALRALEIRESIMPRNKTGSVRGSLVSTVRRTLTKGGTRLLVDWLCAPLLDVRQIQARHDIVERLHDPLLRADLRLALRGLEDSGSDATRNVQRFVLGRGDAYDLLGIKANCLVLARIVARLEKVGDEAIRRMLARVRPVTILERITAAIDEEAARSSDTGDLGENEASPDSPTETWVIRPDYSPRLQVLHRTLRRLQDEVVRLGDRLRLELKAPSLTLRTFPNWGYIAHLRKSDEALIKALPAAHEVHRTKDLRYYALAEWQRLGLELERAKGRIRAAEAEALETLRALVLEDAPSLRKNARLIDEVDVLVGFAELAQEMRLVRPDLDESTTTSIAYGRHIAVESALASRGRSFTPNSCTLDDLPISLVTGPNMGGKSTFLRQTALITILAQAGSFVPARSAKMGLVDQVLVRVGAADDLYTDQSTFMVEMNETAQILRRATSRSLVIMDEVGRGTTTLDGLAVAFATLWWLHERVKCRALFATHYHELADMLGYRESATEATILPLTGISFLCTDVGEYDGTFSYLHRVRPGVNRDSHGLKVAALANMPDEALQMATRTLEELKARRQV